MSLINKEIIKLVEDVKFACGNILKRKFTKPLEKDDKEFDNSKLEVIGSPEPGAKVEIYWTKEWEFEDPDYGYIFNLPITYEDDVLMDGIIHIPKPQGGEKCQNEPEWYHINRLLDNDNVVKVKIFEK